MRKRSDTDPAPRGPEPKPDARDATTQPGARDAETQPGAGEPELQTGAREPEVRPDAMKPEPAARDAEAQPGARDAETQPGAAIRKRAEAGRGSREGREGRVCRVVCYLRRHARAVARLLCGAGALAVLGTLRGEVPLLFALLALWGAGELLYGALRRRE